MFTFLSDAMFLTMQCLPILNDAMFRRCFDKNIALRCFLKKPKHRAYDVMHISDVMTIFVPRWNQEVQVHPMQKAFQSKY